MIIFVQNIKQSKEDGCISLNLSNEGLKNCEILTGIVASATVGIFAGHFVVTDLARVGVASLPFTWPVLAGILAGSVIVGAVALSFFSSSKNEPEDLEIGSLSTAPLNQGSAALADLSEAEDREKLSVLTIDAPTVGKMVDTSEIESTPSPKEAEQDGFQPVSVSDRFFETTSEAIGKAIQTIKEGKTPYAFVPVLTEEEKQFFDALMPLKLALMFSSLGIDINHQYKLAREFIDEKDPETERAVAILKRIIRLLDVHQLYKDSFASARLNVPHWHTDSGFLNNQDLIFDQTECCAMRMTWVIKGPATQVFVPTRREYEELRKVSEAGQKVFDAIKKITDADPSRVITGKSYDMFIFHRGTIHRGFSNPSSEYPDRTVFTTFNDENVTCPLQVQYQTN